jgi:hypothetical protein
VGYPIWREEELNMRPLQTLQFLTHPSAGPVASDANLTAFEKLIQHRLPSEYITLLTQINGGQPLVSLFSPRDADDGSEWEIDRFYHLGKAGVDSDELATVYEAWQTELPEACVPIACDSGGNQIYLDFRKTPPAVGLWIHDEERSLPVAHTFEEFIDSLKSPE